jgi:hypothetical protein
VNERKGFKNLVVNGRRILKWFVRYGNGDSLAKFIWFKKR